MFSAINLANWYFSRGWQPVKKNTGCSASAQSTGAVKYGDCMSADPLPMSILDMALNHLMNGALVNVEYPSIAITPSSTCDVVLVWIQSFPFFLKGCLIEVREPSLPNDLPIAWRRRRDWFMLFSEALARNETTTALSRIWTLVADSISCDDNRYTKHASLTSTEKGQLWNRISAVFRSYPLTEMTWGNKSWGHKRGWVFWDNPTLSWNLFWAFADVYFRIANCKVVSWYFLHYWIISCFAYSIFWLIKAVLLSLKLEFNYRYGHKE